jgi:UDPglucose 6-dehydrogenase
MKEIFPDVEFTNDLENTLSGAYGAILLTEWNELRSLNPESIKNLMKGNVFLDSRNIYKPDIWREAGFKFDNMGRLK